MTTWNANRGNKTNNTLGAGMSNPGSTSDDEEYEEDVAEEAVGGMPDVASDKEPPKETEKDEADGADGADEVGEADEKDEDALFLQHGAHREYRVPDAFVLHRAKYKFEVADGVQLGEIIASRAVGKWSGLTFQHIFIIGGPNKMTKEPEQAPYVIFSPKGDVDSDDDCWLRPVPTAVMAHYQQKWKEDMKDKCGDDADKLKRVKKKFELVLKWSEDKMNGPRLNPERLGVGKGGFVLLGTKLRSIKISPEVMPRGSKSAKTTESKAKLTSAISKGSKTIAKSASRDDVMSEMSEFTQVAEAKTVLLGNIDAVQCFSMNGKMYATLF